MLTRPSALFSIYPDDSIPRERRLFNLDDALPSLLVTILRIIEDDTRILSHPKITEPEQGQRCERRCALPKRKKNGEEERHMGVSCLEVMLYAAANGASRARTRLDVLYFLQRTCAAAATVIAVTLLDTHRLPGIHNVMLCRDVSQKATL
jgi:hypothetical protein